MRTIISRYYNSLRSIVIYPPLTQHTPIQVLVPAPAPWSFTVPRLLISTRLLEYAAPKTPAFSHRLTTAVASYKLQRYEKFGVCTACINIHKLLGLTSIKTAPSYSESKHVEAPIPYFVTCACCPLRSTPISSFTSDAYSPFLTSTT